MAPGFALRPPQIIPSHLNGLEGGALVRGLGENQVGYGRWSPAAAFVSGARGRRQWSKLGLRIITVAAARPTDLEAGNVEWLDLSKQDGEDEINAQGPQGNVTLDLPPQSHADQRRREQQFASILQVPKEERDRVQKIEVLPRAAAALAAC